MTRDQVMPPIPPKSLARMVGLPVFMTLSWLGKLAATLFFAAIWLGFRGSCFFAPCRCATASSNRAASRPRCQTIRRCNPC